MLDLIARPKEDKDGKRNWGNYVFSSCICPAFAGSLQRPLHFLHAVLSLWLLVFHIVKMVFLISTNKMIITNEERTPGGRRLCIKIKVKKSKKVIEPFGFISSFLFC